ncbi:uncharacterized protein LOC130647833 [Hydractinia symbiolongicarpus]|uniref:uncharacterized protein LOC130647833 n=1 Tax=Hydractinia symbiolongicarpus TaxID=13093 RepID=UPI00254D8DD6|nr:uncharacterized protein LOC130647833 [Hydractinia symbiolongicarpus]
MRSNVSSNSNKKQQHFLRQMATFQVSKPVNQDGLLLPAYFRQLFGCTWDIFYGLLVITSIILANWCAVDQNYYLLLLTMYIDFCIICDICMSMFIRFFQTVQVVAVNRNIEAVFIACRNIFGLWLDFTSCIPYISLMLTTTRLFCINAYTTVCLLRMGRLFTPRRMSLDQDMQGKVFTEIRKKMNQERNMQMSLREFENQWNLAVKSGSKKRKTS